MMRRTNMVGMKWLLCFIACSVCAPAWGQSGSRRVRIIERDAPPLIEPKKEPAQKEAPKAPKAEPAKESAPVVTNAPPPSAMQGKFQQTRPVLVLDGLDIVSLIESNEKQPGVAQHETTFDGQVYRFATADHLARFEAKPASYAPALGGMSVVAYKDKFAMVPGSTEHYTNYGNRIYLFADAEEKKEFDASPGKYFDADVLMDGLSPVSLVDEEVLRRGDTQFLTICDGRRVFLASDEELQRFSFDNGKYYPTLGGLDPVGVVRDTPSRGVARFSAVYKNRLYMMHNEDHRREFLQNPEPYSDLDVANKGMCPVSQIEDKREVPGHYGISVVYRGGRLLFASEQKQQRFLESPQQFDVLPKKVD